MRISDWSSDVCSSDLWGGIVAPEDFNPFAWQLPRELTEEELRLQGAIPGQETKKGDNILNGGQVDRFGARMRPGDVIRSEEHTSELQSLMRISYAVFCLKKKKKRVIRTHKSPKHNI